MRVKIIGLRNRTADAIFLNVNPIINAEYPALKLTFSHLNQQLGGCTTTASMLIGCDVEFNYLAAGTVVKNSAGEESVAGKDTHVDYKSLQIIRTPEMEALINVHMMADLAAGMLAAAAGKVTAKSEDMA